MKIKNALLGLALVPVMLANPASAKDAPKVGYAIPAPPKGKGLIVFFRPGAMGFLISCAVSENGGKISSLPPGKFFALVAEPGKHSYTVESEAKDTLNVEIEPDETQFSECHIKMGIMAGRPVLRPATAEEFKSSTSLKPASLKAAAPEVLHFDIDQPVETGEMKPKD
jgi:hypothetical protein